MKNTDVLLIELIDTRMDIKITQNDINRTHRIGTTKTNGKQRLVIIIFVWYNDRKKVFCSKKLLTDLGVSITERLTAFGFGFTFGFRNVWTVDRRIFYSENGSQHSKICDN